MVTRLSECEHGWLDPEEGIPVNPERMTEVAVFNRGEMTDEEVEARVREAGADVYIEPMLVFPPKVLAYAF